MEIPHTSITYQTVARDRPASAIRINAAAGGPCRGWLTADGQTIPVALGRGGIRANKREGDGGTPKGTFRPAHAWCEDPQSRHYNHPVRLEPGCGADRLTRDDHLYDFIVEIDHNSSPRIAGRGSAVFLHLARENFG